VTAISRRTRQNPPVDVASFTPDVDAALRAFTTDVSYAVSIARSAVTIARKRDLWQTRKAFRAADDPMRQP
jgi:hypothetical protein